MSAFNQLAAFFTGTGAAKKQPGLSTGLEYFPMATVIKIAPVAQPEHATIHWLKTSLDRARYENFSERVIMTAGVAQALLDSNPNNRNISEKKVAEYARDMVSGRWALNGESIIVASDGQLNDGQHRLYAVIEANRPITFWVNFGVARETRTTVDQGMARTAAHYLAMDGVQNAALSAGIAGIVMAIENTGGRSMRDRRTHGEVLSRVHTDAEISIAASFADKVRKYAKGLLTPSQIGACYYLFAEVHADDAHDFLTQVCVGENIKRGDPAFAVRQALVGFQGEQRLARLEVACRGFVAYRQGRKLMNARVIGSLPALV